MSITGALAWWAIGFGLALLSRFFVEDMPDIQIKYGTPRPALTNGGLFLCVLIGAAGPFMGCITIITGMIWLWDYLGTKSWSVVRWLKQPAFRRT